MSILLSELKSHMDVLRTRPDAFVAGFTYSRDMPRAINHINQLEAENARLRKAIEDAPIGDQCDGMQCIRIFEEWQAKTLGEQSGTI